MPTRLRSVIVAAGILLLAVAAQAQEEDLEEELFFDAAETVSSAARHEQEIGWSPSAITVITREDIDASGATTIPDLLRLVPGMDVVLCSPFYTAISARLQWNFENVFFLVLIDGREANLELIGWAPWEIQPISIEEVERIEVIRGPASSLYGPNAFAGVVSITTRPASDRSSGWARLSGGEIGRLSGAAGASARLGDWGLAFSGGGNLMGRFSNPRRSGSEGWKFRALAERSWPDQSRLLVDGGISEGAGATTSAAGMVDFGMALTTLRLAYESDRLRAQLYWSYLLAEGNPEAILEYQGVRLARFASSTARAHTVDSQLQWTLPTWWSPLLIIIGGGARVSMIQSDDLLDADSYADITSPGYHQPGVTQWEARTGAFAHAELKPGDWVTLTGGLRFDYNNITGEFLSPRLAGVFQPAPGQFLRLGVARAFRKPAFLETGFHMQVEFFEDSPIVGTGRQDFLEFMTRLIGNQELDNEEIWSFEAGYLGRFLDARLSISLDLFANLYTNVVEMAQEVYATPQGLPDLDRSAIRFHNADREFTILGGELAARYSASKAVTLHASWALRHVYDAKAGRWLGDTPKSLLTLGGRFRTEIGLIGSLVLFARSDFVDPMVENPAGILQPYLTQPMDNVFLLLGKIGWIFEAIRGGSVEIGLTLFLPVSPFSAPHFRYHEKGGVVTASGDIFGGDELRRMIAGYVQGAF